MLEHFHFSFTVQCTCKLCVGTVAFKFHCPVVFESRIKMLPQEGKKKTHQFLFTFTKYDTLNQVKDEYSFVTPMKTIFFCTYNILSYKSILVVWNQKRRQQTSGTKET